MKAQHSKGKSATATLCLLQDVHPFLQHCRCQWKNLIIFSKQQVFYFYYCRSAFTQHLFSTAAKAPTVGTRGHVAAAGLSLMPLLFLGLSFARVPVIARKEGKERRKSRRNQQNIPPSIKFKVGQNCLCASRHHSESGAASLVTGAGPPASRPLSRALSRWPCLTPQ